MNFIKLSKIIINTSKISTVELLENKYLITISKNDVSGFMLAGSGLVTSLEKKITICQKNEPNDYEVINKWVTDLK